MPRKARIDAPGALQHIIIRGIERKEIFRDTKDKNVYLKRFGRVLEEGSTACYAWVVIKKLRADNIRMKGDERILGSSDFVESVIKDTNEAFDRRYQNQSMAISLSRLIEKVTEYFDIPVTALTTNSKAATITKARTAFCYLCVREFGFSGAEVARNIHVSPSTVSKAVTRGDAELDRKIIDDVLKYVNISRTSP